MGVFRGEFFFFSSLSIKFTRVGVASNILPTLLSDFSKKVFLHKPKNACIC